MSNKLSVKIVVEVEYELNDEKPYNLITILEQQLNKKIPEVLNCSSVSSLEHTGAYVNSWACCVNSEDM